MENKRNKKTILQLTYLTITARRTLGCRPIRDTVTGGRIEAEQLGTNSGIFLCSDGKEINGLV